MIRTAYRSGMAALALAVTCSLALATTAIAQTQNDSTAFTVTGGSLAFSTVPATPSLGSITLNGSAQTTNATMTNFGVDDATGSGSGWNVTVQGHAGTGFSAVFADYCPNATCGTDTVGLPGYVSSGASLSANSLTLTGTSAFAAGGGSSGTAPTVQCVSGCSVDSATPVKIASAATSAGMGTWNTQNWGATSLALATPSTLKVLQLNESYHLDLVWSLTTGP
jgi:hypothetical protein